MNSKPTRRNVKTAFMVAVALTFLVALASSAYSIGIAPSKRIVDYVAGDKMTYTVDIVNNGHEELEVILYARGEMSENVKISQQMIKLAATDESKTVTVEFTMPEKMETAGQHTADIVAVGTTSISQDSKATVKADLAVISKLVVEVPYPDKYVEARAYVLDTEAGKQISASVPVFNKGKKKIDSAYVVLRVYSAEGSLVEEMKTQETIIKAGDSYKFMMTGVNSYPVGEYTAKATVYYDGSTLATETGFNVGELTVDIKSLVVDQFTLGQVAKFDILLYNSWSTELKNVYAEMQITDVNNKVYSDFKTVATDVQSKQVGRLEGYWYTEGVAPGLYYARVILHYGNKVSQKLFELEVYPDRIVAREAVVGRAISATEEVNIQKSSFFMILIFVMAVVIAVLAYKLRGRKKGDALKQQQETEPKKAEQKVKDINAPMQQGTQGTERQQP